MKPLPPTLALALAAALLGLAGCDQPDEGKPVSRTRLDGKSGPSPTPSPSPSIASQVESACRSIIFEDAPFTHCLAIPSRHRITMELGPDGETPFRSLGALAKTRDAATIAFAVNGGMFDEDGKPIGYYVEDSERLKELSTADGSGNFHMKPNGVFFGTGDAWQIRTADSFLKTVGDRPQFGTQSGPMLVIDGRLHPEITQDGPSRTIRNAVGVDDKGRAHFVISTAPVSFGKIARLYRDELKVKNALYLDGTVSQLWNPSTDRLDAGAPLGPIIVVERKPQPE